MTVPSPEGATPPPPTVQSPQPGWYPNADGKQQWWDGATWGKVKPDGLPALVVWAIVLGSVGLLICLIPFAIFFGFWVAATGGVLGIVALVKHYRGRGVAIAAVAAAGLAIVLGSVISGAVAGTLPASNLAISSGDNLGATDDTPAPAPTPTETPTPTPVGPQLTVAQQQAVIAAEGYLNIGGFSYQGLIDQLSSSYGNGFSVADATVAVDSLHADYNAQAVIAAQGYLKMGGFSHASLVEQLDSAYGNKFTPEQAEYAATQVGL